MLKQVERVGLVAGSEAAPGIVFVHGTRMAAAYWHAQLIGLSDRFRVVAVDLPGHGARRAEPFSHEEALETIIRGMELCRGAAAAVVGHSLGGFLAMDFALKAPARCLGLVLVGCSANARGPAAWPYRLVARLLPLLPERRLTRWNTQILGRLYSAEIIGPQLAAGFGFHAIPAAWGCVFGRDHAAALSAYGGPLLFVNGERDRFFRAGERRFLRTCPRARLLVLPGAGHLCNWDRPAEFTAAIREFAEALYGFR